LFIEASTDIFQDTMDVNITGATICLQEFMKYIEGQKTPTHIINIGRYWTGE
jgi:NAD(P)-dependent dehydrogenase (short-subunit alcohol dehydrogenase family)